MSELTFRIPPYETAMLKFIDDVIHQLLQLDPLLGMMPWTTTEHCGPVRNVRDPVVDQVIPAIQGHADLHIDAVRHTRVEEFAGFLDEIASIQRAEFARHFIQGIMQITSATGNVFDAQDSPFTFDYVLDLLEKTNIEFDEGGNPIMPTAVIPPELAGVVKSWQPTPAQLQRQAEIIRRKKADFDAAKHTRRLS